MYSVEKVKALAKIRTPESFDTLLEIFRSDNDIDVRREAVSSIGRHNDSDKIFEFLKHEAFNRANPMELIYQMFRTCLYRSGDDVRFAELRQKMLDFWQNEILYKMNEYYNFRQKREKLKPAEKITTPLLLIGDNCKTLKTLPANCIQLIFTSPPYYNAREYSDYGSYAEYLAKMGETFRECHRVLEDGRFIIVNVSPVITRRPGREFESIRYPIHYDLHRVLTETGYYFIDEILWVKPEPSVPDRISGYRQTRKPLSYKPNCITESLMVYHKNCSFLLDRNMKDHDEYDKHDDESIDTTNCWYIAPKYDKNHPAVFPEELCRKVLRYYSFEGDAVMDPFAGSGTFGRAARKMGRVPVLREMNTVTNIYGHATREIMLDAARINFEYLRSMLAELENDAENDLAVTISISYNNIAVRLSLAESLIVINALATKKLQIRGGAWSAIGKRVEKPLLDELCDMAGIHKGQETTLNPLPFFMSTSWPLSAHSHTHS